MSESLLEPLRTAIDVRDVLDAIWLAALLGSSRGAPSVSPATPGPITAVNETPPSAAGFGKTASVPASHAPAAAQPATTALSGALYAPGSGPPTTSAEPIRARPLRIPAGSALPNGLEIVRALRLLPTRLPSRVDVELDEAATVDASAGGLGIVPVLRPRFERWFEAALVVDHSPSAEIWVQTVIEIERMLTCSGIFRDVRTFRLERTPTLRLLNESNTELRPGVLRDPTARRIIFVFSPGVANAWQDGTFGRLLDNWGTNTHVVLLHALPRRLWPNTVLGEPAALATSATLGGPNKGLIRRRAWWARARRTDGHSFMLPVLALEPESALRWAEMFSGRRGRTAPIFLVPSAPSSITGGAEKVRPPPPLQERVDLFRANAPEAFRLAVRLAIGPFTMPILQLVQLSLFGRDAQHSQIAEVMLSGLVTRITPIETAIAPEQVQFQFTPDAAALLLESLRRDDARHLSTLLQRYIEQHFGAPRDQLVLLDDPRGPVQLPAAMEPFARLNEKFLRWLERSTQSDLGVKPTIVKSDWEAPDLFGPGLRVFLSSTAQDLVAYRKVADDTILRMSQEVEAMVRFGPLPGEPAAECERKARECDVLVCIVAHRYGFVPDKGLGSITRREVEAAKAAGKDVLVWIVADDYRWAEKKEQDLLTDPTVLADPARVAEVAAGIQGLLDFKAWLRASFVCGTFTTPDDLGRKIALALGARAKAPATTTPAPKRGEIRIVHALQPAPHFHGRDELVRDLGAWVSDRTSPDRVWALVAAGGTGKTAVAERIVARMKPGEANVLVWSFYEQPDADAFLRECNQLFLGEEEGPAGGRLERLARGLRDGRPHLIVLDGLERVQEDAGGGRVRGELSDNTLKLLLRALAAGLGRARALVTSRYPLVDLQDWTNRGYRDTSLDDLSPDAAVAVLRGWGVAGDDDALRTAAGQVGNHALSVAVLGSYLRSFAGGRIEAVQDFDLDEVAGDDPTAAKLARVLAFYAQRLPEEERELLARLSVFPRGVTIDLLGILVDAGGEVAGLLVNAKPRLVALLGSLRTRGLVFEYRSDETVTWTAHPFLRERFRELLGCPAERVFDVVAQALGAGLERSPDTKPSDQTALDRYERLIEAKRLAGQESEALNLFLHGLGGYAHLGQVLGEYERGYRILTAFSATGRPEDLGATMVLRERSLLANELALFARQLGRLAEARAIRQLDDGWKKALADRKATSSGLQNSSEVALSLGRLSEAERLAGEAMSEAEIASDNPQKKHSLAFRAIASHALGDFAAARADFTAATELEGEPLYGLLGSWHARHYIDKGDLTAARALADHGLAMVRRNGWNFDLPRFDALLARIVLAEGDDPTPHLDGIRAWTSRTGEMEYVITAHLLTARYLLARGDTQAAVGEAQTGLLHAVACGYGLLRIELLVALARILLAWPDPPKSIQAAREALDLAAHPDCRYAWGEADSAQAWGEAFFANGELTLAQRAFTRALEVRRRIKHPGVSETERWLTRTV